MASDEDNGQRRAALQQAVLKLQPGHATHADVDNQAGYLTRVVAAQKRFSRLEAAHAVVFALQQPLERIADSFVIVDNINRAFFGNQTHELLCGFFAD